MRFCISRLGSEDPAVHNLAVALLSLDASQVGRGTSYQYNVQDKGTYRALALPFSELDAAWCCSQGEEGRV